jgi:XFP N-terminal domain
VTLEVTRDQLADLPDHQLAAIDAWWRACNYLTVGQIYLQDNPLLERPLSVEDSIRAVASPVMMAVVTVASLDGSINVGAGGQMNTMPHSRPLSMSRSSWMIRLCSPAMTL